MDGDLIVEDDDLEVEVHMNGGSVGGRLRGKKITRS